MRPLRSDLLPQFNSKKVEPLVSAANISHRSVYRELPLSFNSSSLLPPGRQEAEDGPFLEAFSSGCHDSCERDHTHGSRSIRELPVERGSDAYLPRYRRSAASPVPVSVGEEQIRRRWPVGAAPRLLYAVSLVPSGPRLLLLLVWNNRRPQLLLSLIRPWRGRIYGPTRCSIIFLGWFPHNTQTNLHSLLFLFSFFI